MKTVLCSLCLIWANLLAAQETYFQTKYTGMKEGLSFREVTDIVQDKEGIIWVGTKNGLNKFDGYTFQPFGDFKSSSLPALSNATINDLEIDVEGKLWIATDQGLDIFNPYDYSIKSYHPKEIFTKLQGAKKVMEIDVLKNGRKFIKSFETGCSDYYYSCVEYSNGAFKSVIISDKENGKTYPLINDIFEDAKGKTWFRPTNTLLFFQLNENHEVVKKIALPKTFNDIDLSRFLSGNEEKNNSDLQKFGCNHLKEQIVAVNTTDYKNILGISLKDTTLHRFYEFDMENQVLTESNLIVDNKIAQPTNTFYDNNGDLWFLYQDNFYKRNEDEIIKLNTPQLGGANSINCFFQSSDETVWLGTNFGLIRVKELNYPFKSYHNKKLNKNGFGNSMRAVEVSGNSIYCTVIEEGIYFGSLKTKQFELLVHNRYPSKEKEHEINAYGLFKHKQNLWISNRFDPGILKFDLNTKELNHLVDSNNIVGFGTCLLKPKQQQVLWQGTDKGINYIDLENESINEFKPTNGVNTKQFSISALKELSNGEILVGTIHSGIFLINKEKEFIQWQDKSVGLSSNTVQAICESEKYYWAGTTNGLNRIDKQNGEISTYTTNQGLLNNNINGIYLLDSNLWCSTELGISRLNIKNNSFRNFTVENGLPHNEFNRFASTQLDSCRVFFGGLNGLVLVNSKDIYVEEFNPQLIFTGITKYDGKKDSLVYFNLHPEEPVTIGAYDNSFTFHFTSTDYFNTEQITYSYKIEGLDNYWTSIGKENQVRFNRLPAGNYTFKVRTIGSDGLWNKKPLSVPLIIEEVFYKTTWFLILSILFVALLIASIYKYRLNQLKRLHALRLKIASDLHDDVGSILTQISLQSDLIGQDIYTTEEQKEEIEKMAANSRKAVKSMSDVLWSIDSRRDHAGDLADRMRDYLQEMFERTAIQYDFKAINLKEKKRLNVLVKQNIYLIFKEAINNIIKHSNASKVKIKIEELNGKLQLEIKDNGTLSKNEGSLPGQGLQNIKMRAESLKGTLNIDTAKGYALLVEVPI